MVKYFFDSYAFVEIMKENPRYFVYSYEPVSITMLNLLEIYAFLVKEKGEAFAEGIYPRLKKCVVELDDEVIKKAINLKIKQSKNNLSYADCIGYAYALKNKMIFLTGDKEFEKMKNVRFVK